VGLARDLAPHREPGAKKRGTDALTEALLRQEQEVVHASPQHDQRSDDASLRREEKGLARVADGQRLDVVRNHRLQVWLRVGTRHPDEVSGPTSDARGSSRHDD